MNGLEEYIYPLLLSLRYMDGYGAMKSHEDFKGDEFYFLVLSFF